MNSKIERYISEEMHCECSVREEDEIRPFVCFVVRFHRSSVGKLYCEEKRLNFLFVSSEFDCIFCLNSLDF